MRQLAYTLVAVLGLCCAMEAAAQDTMQIVVNTPEGTVEYTIEPGGQAEEEGVGAEEFEEGVQIVVNVPGGTVQYVIETEAAEEAVGVELFEEGVELDFEGVEITEGAAQEAERFELGHISGWPEFMVKWELKKIGFFKTKVPVLYRRTSKLTLYGQVALPGDILQRVGGAVKGCVLGAIGAGVLTSVITSPASFVPSFQATVIACLSAAATDLAARLATEINVGLYTTKVRGEWRRV